MKENSKKAGIHLLEKGKRGIFRVIFSRSGLILVLLAMQVLFLFSIFHWFEAFLPHIYGGVVIFTFFMVLYLLNSAMDPTAKITWLVVVMLLPVFGALLFLYTQKPLSSPRRQLRPWGSPTPEPRRLPAMFSAVDAIRSMTILPSPISH